MLHRYTLIFVFALSSCAHSPNKTNEKTRPDFSEEAIHVQAIADRLEGVLSKQVGAAVAAGNVGAVVGIYHGGQIKYLSFGEVKKGSAEKPDENTLFEIGSLAKPLTGLMLAIAIEEKKLKEDKTLSELKKEWSQQKTGAISLLELATHSSGLPRLPCNLQIQNPQDPYAEYSEKNLIDSLKDSSFREDCIFAVGQVKTRMYSNWGASLLGYVVSSAQKSNYQYLLQQKIAKPLELTQTTVEPRPDQVKRLAQGYDEQLNEAPRWTRKILYGQGAILSTASDLMNVSQAYLHPEVTPISKAIERSKRYFWEQTKSGSLWHNGATGGFASFMKIYPKYDLAVFYLTNTSKDLKCFIHTVESIDCDEK